MVKVDRSELDKLIKAIKEDAKSDDSSVCSIDYAIQQLEVAFEMGVTSGRKETRTVVDEAVKKVIKG